MHIKKLKVKKARVGYQTPCAVQTLNMLSCWAANKDMNNVGPCQEAAKMLHDCMQSLSSGRKIRQSTINFHLAGLQKVLK